MKIKQSKGDRTLIIFFYIIFAVFAIICAYQFYYLIINSISANDLSAAGKVNFIPHSIQFQNYIDVLKLNGLGTAMLVSIGRTVIGTICTVMASAFLGFMFTQENMWHRKLWYRFMVIKFIPGHTYLHNRPEAILTAVSALYIFESGKLACHTCKELGKRFSGCKSGDTADTDLDKNDNIGYRSTSNIVCIPYFPEIFCKGYHDWISKGLSPL